MCSSVETPSVSARRRGDARRGSDGMENGGGGAGGARSAYQFWPPPSSLWHVLLVGSLKASGLPSRAHPSPISLIKVRLTLPARSQAGRAALMLGIAHYSDTLASAAAATEGSAKCRMAPAEGMRDLGSIEFHNGAPDMTAAVALL